MSAEKHTTPPAAAESVSALPEDIATLYSWANLHGIKYRDFSSTRQEFRSQPRPRRVEVEPPVEEAATGKAALEKPEAVAEPVVAQAAKPVAAEAASPAIPVEMSAPLPIASVPIAAPAMAAEPPAAPARVSAPVVEPLPEPASRGFWEELAAAPAANFERELPRAAAPFRTPAPAERLRVSDRWYALNRIAGQPEPYRVSEQGLRTPVLAVFSLAGGVGKTGLVATLGRALAAFGEEVLLVDTNPYGMLHLYYGAQESRPGVVRSFTGGDQDAAVRLLSTGAPSSRLADLLQQHAGRASRILIDIATASADLLRQIARFSPRVLVPLTPDIHSLASLQTLEECFARMFTHADERDVHLLEPVYLLNGFDPAVPLHVEVREILRQRLGDRLLPFALHCSTALSEALAEGMTVMDYSPGAPVAEDYASLASWVRRFAAPADGTIRGRRWSEQERSS
ncbi:cellulose synthase operon protein YhjQ/BcsQ [Silvibacterium dinghuense]|uniref:Uncharacterized protein n=1 Tax=Silvibacterium dinghuense TaxID=1560006 RepID=A0A4Q1SEG5_9BACT|nr:cellulose synthase operon protein YhjQ/BcsQ [Silvibacterium dinghuense]RXS95495.1 hypothetical protein ESZ00_13050 [Silvibacterium dinghuense]GGH13581.1 hypothetical protein GCM10011586_33540 [Silvibacterium dinghuense]